MNLDLPNTINGLPLLDKLLDMPVPAHKSQSVEQETQSTAEITLRQDFD